MNCASGGGVATQFVILFIVMSHHLEAIIYHWELQRIFRLFKVCFRILMLRKH